MPYLIDGNNLVGLARGTARPSDADRSALVAEIADRLRRTRAKATVYFDGPAGAAPSSLGNLTVRMPSSGTADDAIVREVERARAPREVFVVTADRGLARRVRDAGGRTFAPAEFWERFGRGAAARDTRNVAQGDAAPVDPGPIDVDEWLRYFGDERNRK